MPGEQSFRSDDGGDLGQEFPSQSLGSRRQPPLIIVQAEPPSAKLFAKNPVLLPKVVNDLQLALIHPPGNGDQQKVEWFENWLGLQSSLSRVRG